MMTKTRQKIDSMGATLHPEGCGVPEFDGAGQVGTPHPFGDAVWHPRRQPLHRRGTVMMEMLLVLPFLVFILMLVMFFGQGVGRLQEALVMGRYDAWQQAGSGPALSGQGQNQGQANTTKRQLNHMFFNNAADGVNDLSDANVFLYPANDNYLTFVPGEMIQRGYSASPNGFGDLTTHVYQDFPGSIKATFITTFASNVRLWQSFEQPIDKTYTRLGNNWKFANRWIKDNDGKWAASGSGPSMLTPTREVYLQTMDDSLKYLAQSSNQQASFMRDIYNKKPSYIGPTVKIPQ